MGPLVLGAAGRILGCALVVGVATATLTIPAAAQAPPRSDTSVGTTVDELLNLARQLNPMIAARALETDAAKAKADTADALDDPMARITSDEVDRTSGGRINKMIFSVEQEFPLWGKRDLRRRIAQAEVNGAEARQRATTLELEGRVKVAFAQYYRAARSIGTKQEIHALLRAVAQTAQRRYAQGLGSQSDAIRAEIERSRIEVDFAALERDKRASQGRLNALVGRPGGSPLVEPSALRPVPAAGALQLDGLLDRARQRNPAVATASAEITAAEGARQLVDKSWFPDVSLGAGAITRDDGPPGFMATVGLRVPLQWGLRDAKAREASARKSAAQSQRDAALLDIQAELAEAIAGLEAARRTETLLATTLKPQTEAAYRAALSAYEFGRGDLTAVLEVAQRVQQVQLEILTAQAEQRMFLAAVERVVGDDL